MDSAAVENMCRTGKNLMNHNLIKSSITAGGDVKSYSLKAHNFRRRFKKLKNVSNIHLQKEQRPVVLNVKFQQWQQHRARQIKKRQQKLLKSKNFSENEFKYNKKPLSFSKITTKTRYRRYVVKCYRNINRKCYQKRRRKKQKIISYSLSILTTKNRFLKDNNIKHRQKNFLQRYRYICRYRHKIKYENNNNNNNDCKGVKRNSFSDESDDSLTKNYDNDSENEIENCNSSDKEINEEIKNLINNEINNNIVVDSNSGISNKEEILVKSEWKTKLESTDKPENKESEEDEEEEEESENETGNFIKIVQQNEPELDNENVNIKIEENFWKENFEDTPVNEERNSEEHQYETSIKDEKIVVHEEFGPQEIDFHETDIKRTIEQSDEESDFIFSSRPLKYKNVGESKEENFIQNEVESNLKESGELSKEDEDVESNTQKMLEINAEEIMIVNEKDEQWQCNMKVVEGVNETSKEDDEQDGEHLLEKVDENIEENNEAVEIKKTQISKESGNNYIEEKTKQMEDQFLIDEKHCDSVNDIFNETLIENSLNEYDHNRLLGQQQHQNGNLKNGSNTINGTVGSNRIKDNNSTVIVATNTPLSVCNGNSPTAGTKLRNGNINSTSNSTTTSNHGSPNNIQKKHLQSQQPGQQNARNLQSQHYQKQQQRHHQQQQQQQQQQQEQLQQQQQENQLHQDQQEQVENEKDEKENEQEQNQQHGITQNNCKTSLLDLSIPEGNKSVEALGVLLQYLVYDLDAFTCPSLKQDYQQAQKNLLQTQSLLDDARATCHDLQDQLIDKEHYYMTREQELQALHRCELNKAETSLIDFQSTANERISILKSELLQKDEENNKKFESFQQQSELKIQQLEKELQRSRSNESDLIKRIEILTVNENELRDRMQDSEDNFAKRLQTGVQRERDLNDKITLLTKQLEIIRLESEQRERELEEKFNLSQNELTIIRNQNLFASLNNSNSSSTSNDDIKIRSPKTAHGNGNGCSTVMSLSMSSNSNSNRVQMLESEVESLRSVMDIKLNDICELRKKNQELLRATEEFEALKIKYSGMESRLEDLQIQLRAKDEEKQELVSKIKHLQETCAQEAKNRSRVLLHNEELQYRLKQNSEKFNAFVAELSKSEHMSCSKGSLLLSQDNADLSQNSSLNSTINTSLRPNGCPMAGLNFEEEDDSPPGSPIIKGVVKKSDSVSWVLQMDDELPEVVASRMVKRAGSFRSSFNEKLQNAKRQLSLPSGQPSVNGCGSTNTNSNSGNSSSINPLQQSASATMLNLQNQTIPHQRQHSNSESEYGTILSPRVRSKSINIKGCDQKKQSKQSAHGSLSKKCDQLGSWKEPICSSSPYARHTSKFQKLSHSPPKGATSNVLKQITKSYSHDNEEEDEEDDVVAASSASINNSVSNNDANTSKSADIFCRKNSRHLITCDTLQLTTNERLEMRQSASNVIPSHSSVQDLKSLKKSQPQIQESAGEAMVSGTNSEDESCSGSSDESPSQSQSISSDTNSSSSNSSDHHHHHHHKNHHHHRNQNNLDENSLAIEEALLIDKFANSLDGTPMEVSWSSDAEPFPPESIV